ncbi:MAG: MFS transporter, partial [Clostridia bacterium]|nr:MFS transporter [Clostridia bacterium]
GLILPLTMSSAIESVPNERRGAAMGIYQAVYGLGMFLGPVIAGAVIERFSVTAAGDVNAIPGYVANFYVAMGIAIAGGVLAVLLTPGKQARREEKRA